MASFPQRRPRLPIDLSGGPNQTINDFSIATASWTVLAAAIVAVVSISASAAVASWTVPAPAIVSPVSIATGVATATWVVPGAAASAGGPQSIDGGPAIASWAVPAITTNLSVGSVDVATASWVIPAPTVQSPISLTPGAIEVDWVVPSPALVATVSLTPASSTASWVIPATVSPINYLADTATASWVVPDNGVTGGAPVVYPSAGATFGTPYGGGTPARPPRLIQVRLAKRIAGGLGPRQWVWRKV